MLKVEKITPQSEITLKFQKKEFLFNRAFFKALSLALSLHAIAFLIFKVGPFKLINNGKLPPAIVETDSLESDFQVASNIAPDGKSAKYPMAPQISALLLPPSINLALTDPLEKMGREILNDHYFLSEIKIKSFPAIQISLTGPIANKSYEDLSALLEEEQKILLKLPKNSFHAIYSVKIENKTGRIFFAEPKEAPPAEFISLIDTIIKKIRFEKENMGFLASGEIEISIHTGTSGIK